MIQKFVDRFIDQKAVLRKRFEAKHPAWYGEIVRDVITVLNQPESMGGGRIRLNADRICEIDEGDYQGTLVYVIPEDIYQPSDFWYVKVSYGSYSACDTLQSIRDDVFKVPTPLQVEDYMTLALHIVQGLKHMGDDDQGGIN